MLDIRRLQVLRAVVTSGSVRAAAAHLGYTPSAISQQIGALERQAGLPLLERIGRGVQPTVAGRLLAEHAAVITGHVAAAETALADLRAGRSGRLVVRYFASAGAGLVPPAVAALRVTHPDVRIDLTLADPAVSLPEVERGDADLALVVSQPGQVRDGTVLIHLLDDPYRAVLPRDHPLAGRRVVDLADLAGDPWVDNQWSPGPCLDAVLTACAAAGFTPAFAVQSADHATAQGLVAAGLGVTLIPRLGLTSHHPGVVVRQVRNPEPVRPIQAAVREAALRQPAVRHLLDALRATAAA